MLSSLLEDVKDEKKATLIVSDPKLGISSTPPQKGPYQCLKKGTSKR